MLQPLCDSELRDGPACDYRPGGRSTLVFAAHGEHPSSDFRNWRFKISPSGFLGGYYEIWYPMNYEKLDEYYLHRAYLTIYHYDHEYLCLHCDPEEPEEVDSRKYLYKRLPHLHLHKVESPIHKAHLAFGYGFQDQILNSDGDLFAAFKDSIELIHDEILSRLQ